MIDRTKFYVGVIESYLQIERRIKAAKNLEEANEASEQALGMLNVLRAFKDSLYDENEKRLCALLIGIFEANRWRAHKTRCNELQPSTCVNEPEEGREEEQA